MKISYLIDKFKGVERRLDVLEQTFQLNRLVVNNVSTLLRLKTRQFRCLVALNMLGQSNASGVARILGIQRAMVSAALSDLARLGLASKNRLGHSVIYSPQLKIKEDLESF